MHPSFIAVIDALARAPEIVVPLVREVPAAILKRRPAPRRWSAHEHACHLAHVHGLFIERLEAMLHEPEPFIAGYQPGDQDADDMLLRMDLDECLERYAADRGGTTATPRSRIARDMNVRCNNMIIETYTHGPAAVSPRSRSRGRLAPDGPPPIAASTFGTMRADMKKTGARVGIAIVLVATSARLAIAQDAGAPRSAATCRYRECALSIAPVWNGLTVVRGGDGGRVANLDFFLPRDISPVLRGDVAGALGADSAFAHARRAVALRRAGAVLTDLGAVAMVVAIARAASAGRASRTDQVTGGAGLAALLVSVPLQFAADGALSRAVWWHNLRYAR